MALSSGGSKKFKSGALFVGFETFLKSQLQKIPPMRVSKKAVFRLSKRCQFGLGRLPRSRELVARNVPKRILRVYPGYNDIPGYR